MPFYSIFPSFLSIQITFITRFIQFTDLERFCFLKDLIKVKEDADTISWEYSMQRNAGWELEYVKNLSLQLLREILNFKDRVLVKGIIFLLIFDFLRKLMPQ